MQVIKPKTLGVLYKTYQIKYHHFAVGAVVFFPLGKNNPKPLVEFDQWKKVMTQLPMGMALDMGFAKPRSEVLACAKGYFHQHGLLYKSSPVIEIGGIKKKVRIPRKQKKHAETIHSFLPIDIMDKRRSRYNGTYNDYWVKNIHPGLPEDTNTLLFNSAADELQLHSVLKPYQFFTPGEKYTLIDVHAEQQKIIGNLPDINVRLFANIDNATENSGFSEIETQAETVWFFPEENLGAVIYRGVVEVQDSDGLDVKQLLMAYENTVDKPRSQKYYENVLSLRTNTKTALAHLFNESQLIPEKTEEEKQRLQVLIEKEKAEKSNKIQKMREQYQQKTLDMVKQSIPANAPGYADIATGVNNSKEKSELDIPEIPSAVLESGDFDLTELLDATDKLQEKLTQEMTAKQKELEKVAGDYSEQYKNDMSPIQETMESIKQRLSQPIYCMAKDLKKQGGQENPATVAMQVIMQQLPQEAKEKLAKDNNSSIDELSSKMTDAYDQLMMSQKQARLASPELARKYQLSQEQQQQARQQVEELMSAEECLAGRDLSGIDLSKMDFSRQDMRDVMLEGCDLSDCIFDNSQLDGASLVEARLDNTRFKNCSITHANLSASYGTYCCFEASLMDNSFLINTKLEAADFSQVKAQNMMATGAQWIKSQFAKSEFSQSHFVNADLTMTHWTEAKINASTFLQAVMPQSYWQSAFIERCMMIDIKAERINFKKAVLNKVQFSNVGDLRNANFSYATFLNCGFRGVDLNKLQAPYAIFCECDFAEALVNYSNLNDSVFKRSLMTLAQCKESRLHRALFNETVVRKVDFSSVEMDDAEFFNCTLEKNIIHQQINKVVSIKPQSVLS